MTVLTAVDVDQPPHQSIGVGYDLATTYDEPLLVDYVMPDEEFDRRQRNRDAELPEEFETYTLDTASDTAAELAADAVDETLDHYDSERIVTRGSGGLPSDVIIEIIEEVDPRYVVVGGRKRSLAKQAIFGSVSQAIIRNVEQPVVTIMEASESE